MNKIFKSGGRWQVLKKRVSPAVIAFQALAVTAAVVLAVMLLEYRSESDPVPAKEFSTTAFSGESADGVIKLSALLDPAAFAGQNHHVPSHFALHDMVKIQLPRPAFRLPESVVPEFRGLPVAESGTFTDLRVPSAVEEKMVPPEIFAVMYDERGKEVARWQIKIPPQREMTVFRIAGNNVLQHTVVTASCGDQNMDKKALDQAMALRLKPGVYAVCYPQTVRQEI
ncbi:MAG: hypothetical protein E7042_00905 [Lentisphaerae bacterium]|nr:hypothetical protein [Lentisphaerota bacterium]